MLSVPLASPDSHRLSLLNMSHFLLLGVKEGELICGTLRY